MYWKEWLQTLLSLVILVGVAEMLLPSGRLAKFSQLVLGLALMLAVLQPLTLLFNADLNSPDLLGPSALWSVPDLEELAAEIRLAAALPFLRQDQEERSRQMEQALLGLDLVEDVQVDMGLGASDACIYVSIQPYTLELAEQIQQALGSMVSVPPREISVQRLQK